MEEFKGTTIQEARDYMSPKLKKGVVCPCCTQISRMYHRPLSSSMTYALLLIFREEQKAMSYFGNKQGSIFSLHLENFFKEIPGLPSSIRGDAPKLRFWGLIEPSGAEVLPDDGNPNNGYYRITDLGRKFAEGKVLLQSKVKIYNNKFYGFTGPEIDVWGALKNKFSYNEVMGTNLRPESHAA